MKTFRHDQATKINAIASLPLGWQRFVMDHSLTFDDFCALSTTTRNADGSPRSNDLLRGDWDIILLHRQ